ncbi:MAG TPA: lysophospholipid acyltransferase family protein [Blastocatellia bacterium]|nr:lysophospholipid acyltransferase family protein [Blastocatellia bacterium]
MQSDIGPATDAALHQDKNPEPMQVADAPKFQPRPGSLNRRRAAREGGSHVDQLRRRVYAFDDLSSFTTRDRLIIRVADLCFYFLIRVICSTLQWDVRGYEHLDSINDSGKRGIFTFWHSCIFSATWFWRNRGIVVMSSMSRDAEFTARLIKRFGYGTARGSATRGSGRALADMADCLDNGMEVAFTIDGPRGPAYVAKPGAVTLARHAGQAILPFHIAVRRHIKLPSWDGLKIPLPFTRAVTLIDEPIYVSREATSDEISSAQATLQSALDKLRAEAEAWSSRR